MVAVSAPGKLILMGEHGAVYGRPAVTTAIGLRVRAELDGGSDDGVELDLPDLGRRLCCGWGEIAAAAETARRRWRELAEGGRFARIDDPAELVRVALGEAAADDDPAGLPPLVLRVRSQLPVGAGFGSSAAAAVAVIAGFLAWRGREPDPGLVDRRALAVERHQHGRPSGIDHRTVLHGGVQWAERSAGGELALRPVAARPELLARLRVVHTGAPAETTGAVVAAVADLKRREPAAFDSRLARMAAATAEFRERLEAPGAGEPATAMREFERCLEEIGVVPAAVREVVRRVERGGGAAKISGAGSLSGDAAGCLLVLPAAAGEPELPAGWRPIDCAMGAEGVRREAA